MNSEESKREEIIENQETNETENTATEQPDAEQHWPEDEVVSDHATKLKEEQEKYLRLYSEFENFRRRTAKERIEFLQSAGKEVILSMLPVIDDFERALKAAESIKESSPASIEGFELIYKKMFGILESMGLQAMESVGKSFDVEMHEAITKIAAGEENKGKVVDEAEKGYLLNDKVIRFAKIIIGE